ncbi:hypothetical protein AB6D11_27235 [Vibrio splendidus]
MNTTMILLIIPLGIVWYLYNELSGYWHLVKEEHKINQVNNQTLIKVKGTILFVGINTDTIPEYSNAHGYDVDIIESHKEYQNQSIVNRDKAMINGHMNITYEYQHNYMSYKTRKIAVFVTEEIINKGKNLLPGQHVTVFINPDVPEDAILFKNDERDFHQLFWRHIEDKTWNILATFLVAIALSIIISLST